jgi:hypothetical protein
VGLLFFQKPGARVIKSCTGPLGKRLVSRGHNSKIGIPGAFLSQTRYIFTGGFLGAGKTTALAALARHFQRQGRRVGVLTNDLGGELADTMALRADGLTVEEVTGGGLSARFEAMAQAARRLEKAEIVLVEPVGCLADLRAGAMEPLQRELGGEAVIAPLSVMVEPQRALEMLGLAPPRLPGSPDPSLRYLYRMQLEEADLIVIAPAVRDSRDPGELKSMLEREFPRARVLTASRPKEEAEWLSLVGGGVTGPRKAPDLDYERYARAVARLGWLDATIEFTLPQTAGGGRLLQALARLIQERLVTDIGTDSPAAFPLDLGHLKIALRTEEGPALGLVSVTLDGIVAVKSLEAPTGAGEFVINLRAETHPENLHGILRRAVVELAREFPGLQTEFAHLHYFRPPRPVPRPA